MSDKLNLPIRPRRNRKSQGIRGLVQETVLTPADLILPLFFHEGDADQPIESMPGCTRWSLDGLVREVSEAEAVGIKAVVLFPAISDAGKTPLAEECFNPEGLVPRAIRAIKENTPDISVITDVALDP